MKQFCFCVGPSWNRLTLSDHVPEFLTSRDMSLMDSTHFQNSSTTNQMWQVDSCLFIRFKPNTIVKLGL